MTKYYFSDDDGKWVGPLRQAELIMLYHNGSFGESTLIRREDAEMGIPFRDFAFPGGRSGGSAPRPTYTAPLQPIRVQSAPAQGGTNWVKILVIIACFYIFFQFIVPLILVLGYMSFRSTGQNQIQVFSPLPR